jgi:pimeloyl-ACP methyl ester carboxylesterase
MIPVSFEGCAGWLHPAAGGRGVVICGAFGFEDLCSHKALAVLADRIARAGQPVLRFAYRGGGDSADLPEGADPTAFWKADIHAATSFLMTHTGVSEIALIGLRLGGALAIEAASETGAARIALIAPPTSGRAYLREVKALSRIIGSGGDRPDTGELSGAGFRLSPSVQAAIGALDPTQIAAAPANKILALGRDGLAAHPVVARLRELGADVETGVFAGYDAMMCDPTASRVPEHDLARIADWIVADAPATGANLACPQPATLSGADWFERTVCFGDDKQLAGVYARSPTETPNQALIILNAGAIYRVGWARGHVELARRLAAEGVASLRIDVAGVGDSFAACRDSADMLYAPQRVADISAAVDWLEAQGISDISLLGACSGAYQALQATLKDRRIKRLALVNQLCYVWGAAYAAQFSAWRATKSSMINVALANEAQAAGEAARFLRRLTPYAKKFAKGSFNALVSLSARASALTSANLVEHWFATLSARGVRTMIVHSADDPGLIELERWLGPNGIRATSLPGVEKHILEDADHTLSARHAREALGTHLFALLGVEENGTAQPRAETAAA